LGSSSRFAREHTVNKLCRYRRHSDPDCFLPDQESLARQKPHPLATIIEPAQVAHLLDCASQLPPGSRSPVRAQVMRLAVVLLYTAGLRRGELVRLTLGDVDAQAGVLRIRESKFHKSRWVPLSTSAQAELQDYLVARRQAGLDERPAAPLLCTAGTRAYTGDGFFNGFKLLLRGAGIRGSTGRCPRVQDFRHSFAVAALLRWYEADADVQSNLPKLALYMGHVNIVSTAYYLRWMPAVISQASARFARSCAGVIEVGAS
ncbi:MAG: tyrosine-type recombinase/integrase, partial [Rhodoferax sp.]|nr:tyrosine-type recombinase/integrase [Rhodoferax sp.]